MLTHSLCRSICTAKCIERRSICFFGVLSFFFRLFSIDTHDDYTLTDDIIHFERFDKDDGLEPKWNLKCQKKAAATAVTVAFFSGLNTLQLSHDKNKGKKKTKQLFDVMERELAIDGEMITYTTTDRNDDGSKRQKAKAQEKNPHTNEKETK